MESLRHLSADQFLIATALVFVAVLLFLEGAWLFWKTQRSRAARKLAQRLEQLSADKRMARAQVFLKDGAAALQPRWQQWLARLPLARLLRKQLQQAGLSWSLPVLALLSVAAGLACWLAFTLLLPLLPRAALMSGLAGAALPCTWVAYRRQRRLAQMQTQLPETLDVMVRALRAGHAFASGLQMSGEEAPEPLAAEFRAAHDEINFGISMQQALLNLCERVPLVDMRFFAVAVLVQRESGGNLTEVLGKLAQLIRERRKLHDKVRVLSAEGRLSAWILGLMPFFLAAIMNLANPEFMSPLWKDPLGVSIIQIMLGLMMVGALVLRKLVRIRV